MDLQPKPRHNVHAPGEGLPLSLAMLMAVTGGIVVANLYYNQPLLLEMQRSFGASPKLIGLVPTLTQVGYAMGILFLVPLADAVHRRRLILLMTAASAVALTFTALARNFPVMAAASFAVGAFSIVPQLLVPFAAYLAKPELRGRAVGFVMSGLLIGILLARTVAGEVGEALGWRAMFWIATGTSIALVFILWRALPHVESPAQASYPELMRSLWRLVKSEPVLREASLTGALLFGCFSCFWATLTFLLGGAPFHYGPRAPGLFGLVGVVGASIAPLAGRFADRFPRLNVKIAVAVTAASFVIFFLFGRSLAGLVAGVILLDAGVQGGQISNQTRVYSLSAEAQNRLNTVYMVSYFAGGALGSALGTFAWEQWGWGGVCGVALVFAGIAGALLVRRDPAAS